MLTPERAQQIGRIGGKRLHTAQDSGAIARRARDGFFASFERAVDPDGVLNPEERRRRAHEALRQHMKVLSERGVAVRQARKRQREAGVAR